MSSAATNSKKRKRELTEDNDGQATFTISTQSASQLGPVLASFPALQPAQSVPFQCYSLKAGEDEKDFATRATHIAGETDAVEFASSTDPEQGAVGCRYMIGVHNKRTNIVTLRPAPIHILTRQVKATKRLTPMVVSDAQRLEARNKLGEAFGTKKAKAAIRAAERNKVDVSAMETVAVHLQESIEANTTALPSREEAKASADSNRLIPPFNADATDPAEVYALHDIIPENEFNALSTSPYTAANLDNQWMALLPFSRSDWIRQHMRLLFAAPKLNKSNLKIIIYISAMLAFRWVCGQVVQKSKLQERMPTVPVVVIDGLIARFTETSRGSTEAMTTTSTQTSLLTHILALCLRVDNFATDPTLIAGDLNMDLKKITPLFKSLGCTLEFLQVKDQQRLGLPESARNTKRAVLKTPLKFPKPRVGKRKV